MSTPTKAVTILQAVRHYFPINIKITIIIVVGNFIGELCILFLVRKLYIPNTLGSAT